MYRFFLPLLTFLFTFTIVSCSDSDTTDEAVTEDAATSVVDQVAGAEYLLPMARASRTLRVAARAYLDQSEGQDAGVVEMAREVLAVQQTARQNIQQLAAARRINLPAELMSDAAGDEIEEMMGENGPEDLAQDFLSILTEEHEQIADALDDIERAGTPADMREFAATMRAYLNQHEVMMERLDEMVN